jgi:hypothetical protein
MRCIQGVKMISHIPDDLSRIIQQFADDSKQLLRGHVIGEYLFGSYATNKYSPLSDIDILIIVDKLTPELRWQMSGLASDYSLEYDIYISPIIKDEQVWINNRKYNTLFYQEVVQHGIPL